MVVFMRQSNRFRGKRASKLPNYKIGEKEGNRADFCSVLCVVFERFWVLVGALKRGSKKPDENVSEGRLCEERCGCVGVGLMGCVCVLWIIGRGLREMAFKYSRLL